MNVYFSVGYFLQQDAYAINDFLTINTGPLIVLQASTDTINADCHFMDSGFVLRAGDEPGS